MNRRNQFLTYLLALFPGIGYMYLGLVIRGVETLAIFLVIDPIFSIVGFDFMTGLIKIPIWLYVFFDTINIAKRLDNGEKIQDEDFILKRFNGTKIDTENNFYNNEEAKKSIWIVLGWVLVVVGVIALLNRVLYSFGMYDIIRSYVRMYFIPFAFILIGAYLLFRNKK
jgi:TM2 domain-containing membrane protein YozV